MNDYDGRDERVKGMTREGEGGWEGDDDDNMNDVENRWGR